MLVQDGPVDSQTLDFLFYGGTELGGGRWQSGLGSYMSSCLFVLLPLPIMGWGRWAGVGWGEGRKGHITARGYGGPEPASGSRGETLDLLCEAAPGCSGWRGVATGRQRIKKQELRASKHLKKQLGSGMLSQTLGCWEIKEFKASLPYKA